MLYGHFSINLYRVVCSMWVSLVPLLLYFPKEPRLSPDLSGRKVGKQNQTFWSSPATLSLLQNFWNMPSIPYIYEVGDTVWRQTDLVLGFLRIWFFSEKHSDEVSNWMSLLHSWIPILLWHSTCLELTLQWLWSDKIADNFKLT